MDEICKKLTSRTMVEFIVGYSLSGAGSKFEDKGAKVV